MLEEKNKEKRTLLDIVIDKKNNQNIILKCEKQIFKYKVVNGILGAVSVLGLGFFAFNNNPLVRLAGFGVCASSTPAIWLIGNSKKYKHILTEYNAALANQEAINEEFIAKAEEIELEDED